MGKRAAILRVRGVRAAVCLLAALLACFLLLAAHWRPGPFSVQTVAAARAAGRGPAAAVSWPQGAVDVNTATAEELQALHGVGPALAEAIVGEREERGPFDYPEDLLMVKGIGEKKLAGFYDQLDFSSR